MGPSNLCAVCNDRNRRCFHAVLGFQAHLFQSQADLGGVKAVSSKTLHIRSLPCSKHFFKVTANQL